MSDVVVITGASSGIGGAAAHLFARAGRSLALIARGSEALEATRREMEALGARALVIPLDVADDAAVEATALCIEVELGPINLWVNNAMVNVWGEFLEIPEAEFRRITEVGYFGYLNGTRAALRRMKPRDKGSIVQVGSMISYVAAPLQSAYSGVKHAIRGFTDAVRAELTHAGSRVPIGMVLPASINTPFYDTAGNRLRE
jgi:short-subunit dehydrogenase